MDQIKIGKFIAQCRKKQNLTQLQLADRLGITDRAVSKWENGKGMPDTSLMLELCDALAISVNELLCGEYIDMNEYNQKADRQLLEMARQQETKDKQMLQLGVFIGTLVSVVLLACVAAASFLPMADHWRILLIVAGFIPFVIGIAYCLRIEQTAGYYECKHCHHKYVPTYQAVLWSMHYYSSRYMKCPSCGKKSYHKKVISK